RWQMSVSISGSARQGPRDRERDPRPTGLARRRLHQDLAKAAEIAAAIADRLAAPQLAQLRDRRREARASLAQGYAASLEFLWEFAADADAENQPTFAQVIERCGLLRDRHGMAQRHEIDIGAELEPPADHGRLRQLQKRIENRDGEGDMVADPKRIVAAIIDKPDQR